MRTVSLADDFSATPGGRYNRDGPYSGEAFRARFLEPAVDAGEGVVVSLDHVAGLPSSFLEEAFGGLIRSRPFVAARPDLVRVETHEADLRPYVGLIERYMVEAAQQAKRA